MLATKVHLLEGICGTYKLGQGYVEHTNYGKLNVVVSIKRHIEVQNIIF